MAAIPFLSSFQPSARAKAIGAPVEADISSLEPGQRIIVKWRGKPVWIVRRTEQQVEQLNVFESDMLQDPESAASEQPEFAQNAWRSDNSEYLVLVGFVHIWAALQTSFLEWITSRWAKIGKEVSTVLVMGLSLIWQEGFMRECLRLLIWQCRYRFLSDNRILIGELDGENA